MTTRSLPAGRRRAFFGLLDAEGWAWASLKATAWFIIIIFLLGYLPDRAYYVTVNRTLDLGILAWSPINFCPPSNDTLPCPAPNGAVVPWQPSDAPALPETRTGGAAMQVVTTVMYIGGSDGSTARDDVFVAAIEDGELGTWSAGPALPEPRTDASVAFFGGSVYVVGGYGADGAPTTTTFVLSPDTEAGELGDWEVPEALALPEARADAAIVAVADGIVLIGGDSADGVTNGTWKATFDPTSGELGGWQQQPALLVSPSSGAIAAQIGDFIWLYGGRDGSGPTAQIQRGRLATPEGMTESQVVEWAAQPPGSTANLPAGRTDAAGWSSFGSLYLVGGSDGTSLQPDLWWATPTGEGEIVEWRHLEQTDLPAGITGSSALVSGSRVFLVGGTTAEGVTGQILEASLAPEAPFFQLGLVGATVPALNIEGEIGQQIGYLNAAGVGTILFIGLILVGVAMAHPERTRELAGRVRRRGR